MGTRVSECDELARAEAVIFVVPQWRRFISLDRWLLPTVSRGQDQLRLTGTLCYVTQSPIPQPLSVIRRDVAMPRKTIAQRAWSVLSRCMLDRGAKGEEGRSVDGDRRGHALLGRSYAERLHLAVGVKVDDGVLVV